MIFRFEDDHLSFNDLDHNGIYRIIITLLEFRICILFVVPYWYFICIPKWKFVTSSDVNLSSILLIVINLFGCHYFVLFDISYVQALRCPFTHLYYEYILSSKIEGHLWPCDLIIKQLFGIMADLVCLFFTKKSY